MSVLRREAFTLAGFLGLELRRQVRAEVLGLEHAADLDFLATLPEGRAADPLDRLLDGFHLPEPEPRDQLLALGERPVDHGALATTEPDAHARGAGLQPFTREHH